MELFMNLMYILVTSVLVENVVLAKFLGCCPFWVYRKSWFRRWHELGSYLRYADGYRSYLANLHLSAGSAGTGLFADHRLHPGSLQRWFSWSSLS